MTYPARRKVTTRPGGGALVVHPLVNLEVVSECGLRASARDRESATKVLREAHVAGRLSLDEFAERTDAVYSAVTLAELSELTADLPEGAVLARRAAHQAAQVQYGPQRPFGQVWGTVVIWLIIAAVAHVFAAIPLVVLSAFVLIVTHWRDRRRQRDDRQAEESDGS
jgi:uncharacterized membrane protein